MRNDPTGRHPWGRRSRPTGSPLPFRRRIRSGAGALGVAAALALVTACGGAEPPAADGTDDTSRSLLSSVTPDDDSPQGGRSVPSVGQSAPDSIEIDVGLLGHDRGDSLAPVQIVEMSDYGCGYCRQFHQETWPVIRDEFIATGKVRWKFLPFVTGMFDNSLVATEGAECALAQGPELFETLNAHLWDDQRAWKSAGSPRDVVEEMAREAGVDMAAWTACMDGHERVTRIRAATALSRDLGVRGTPTFFVMGYPPLQGALPTETFTELLQMIYTESVREGGADGAQEGGPGGNGAGGPF